jgi:hypothetical protein
MVWAVGTFQILTVVSWLPVMTVSSVGWYTTRVTCNQLQKF